jgi:outer membrane immunogenic protein
MLKTFIASATALVCAFAATQATAADFTGPRLEAHAGYDNASFGGFSQGGFAYGIGAGYDFAATPNLIIGIEVNADLASTNIGGTLGTITAKLDTKRDLSALVRFGGKVSENALLYVKVGYANGRLSGSYIDTANPASNITAADNGDGIRGGVGFEYAITPKAYAKVEYQYTNYEADFSRNQGLVGIGFRF